MATRVTKNTLPPPGKCSACHTSATTRCIGCLGAPSYDESVSTPTFYCGHGCQKADWSKHRSQCRKLQARKTVHRAALLFQGILYRIKLNATTLRFKSVRKEGDHVYLEGCDTSLTETQKLKPLPACFDGDRGLLEAVSVYMACTESSLYLHEFVKEFLAADICSDIEEVNVSMTNMRLRISVVSSNGPHLQLPDIIPHNLYRVTLKNGEKWAIDPAGAQFGYADPLYPWPRLEKERGRQIGRAMELGHTRRVFDRSGAKSPIIQAYAQIVEKQELAKSLDDKTSECFRECGGFNTLLGGTDTVFDSAKDRFLDQVEVHLKLSLAKMYTREQTAKRNKKMEREFSQIMADPNTRNYREGAMKYMASVMAASASRS